jgi:hypothetical protein
MMKRFVTRLAAILLLLVAPLSVHAAFTEFYCDPVNGSNLNSGSTTSASAAYTATNGNWDGSSVFTPASGNPSLTVNVGDFASVYLDAASTAVYVARVTAVSSTTITLSTTAKCGTAPTSGATGRSCKVGGAFKGPNAADGVPLTIIAGALTNASGDFPRVNLKNNGTYSITASIATTGAGPVTVEGYTSSAGDLGRATFDGGSGTGYDMILLSVSSDQWMFLDLISQNAGSSGTTGSNINVPSGCNGTVVARCKFAGSRLENIVASGDGTVIYECECTDWNKSNSSNRYAIANFSADHFTVSWSFIHDANGSSNNHGIRPINTAIVDHTVFSKIGGSGIRLIDTRSVIIDGCDFYSCNNGFEITNTSGTEQNVIIRNSNFVKNTVAGVNGSGTAKWIGLILNCGYGTGTQANGTDTTGLKGIVEAGKVSYASGVTPWNDPANGDFTITLAAAKTAGRGAFGTGLTSTTAYPDIGAAQSRGGGISRSRVVNR